MIRSFADRATLAIFRGLYVKSVDPVLQRKARQKLLMIDAATRIADLLVPPGNRLEKLSGDRKDQHSIRVNDQWRICFVWRDDSAYDVELIDYH
ncbi:MAG: type II toxin-antitoxin system RelE/ParE family toxin [Thalassobaculum sp.]|uniref:type II toxin-antitoxin system RelE/ParE family toxin n=1 Tax=Thalassobaculum sp. TaxID=2022740 RepID=UPI0032EEEDA4